MHGSALSHTCLVPDKEKPPITSWRRKRRPGPGGGGGAGCPGWWGWESATEGAPGSRLHTVLGTLKPRPVQGPIRGRHLNRGDVCLSQMGSVAAVECASKFSAFGTGERCCRSDAPTDVSEQSFLLTLMGARPVGGEKSFPVKPLGWEGRCIGSTPWSKPASLPARPPVLSRAFSCLLITPLGARGLHSLGRRRRAGTSELPVHVVARGDEG